jgi:hypothetical protein
LIGAEAADIINVWSCMIEDVQQEAHPIYRRRRVRRVNSVYLGLTIIDVLGLRAKGS